MTRFYPDLYFKVAYEVDPVGNSANVKFLAWDIDVLDTENVEESECDGLYVLEGFVKWDGCCEFQYDTHICGLYRIEQFHELMKEIYKFAKEHGGFNG